MCFKRRKLDNKLDREKKEEVTQAEKKRREEREDALLYVKMFI